MKKILKHFVSYGLALLPVFFLVLVVSACTSTSSTTPAQSATDSPPVTTSPVPSESPVIPVTPAATPTPTISPSPSSTTTTQAPAPVITTTSLQDGEVGMPYSQNLQATGGSGTYTWSISSDFLPQGLILNPKTGTISGTPAAAATCFFDITVIDTAGTTSSRVFTLTIDYNPSATPPVSSPVIPTPASPTPTGTSTPAIFAITTSSLPDSAVGMSYSQPIQVSDGSTPFVWSYWSGPLPDGLYLDAATGIIFGKPTTAGTFNFTIQVTDSSGAIVSKSFSINISS